MRKFLSHISFLICILFVINSCKKYPENDRIYLKTVKARLINHDWYFKKLTVNGVDSTDVHAQRFGTTPGQIKFKITKNLDKLNLIYPGAANGYRERTIQFDKKKKKMKIFEFDANSEKHRLFIVSEEHELDIVKLTTQDFVLTFTNNDNQYRFEFIK